MSRRLIGLLECLEYDTDLADNATIWLDTVLDGIDERVRELIKQIEGEGRLTLYAARGCANIPAVDLLQLLGYQILQYPVKHLVIQTRKGRIPLPGLQGELFIREEPKWRMPSPRDSTVENAK